MIARLLLVLCSMLLLFAAVPAKAYTDWSDVWFTPSEPGWGVNLVQSADFMFATFFVYGQDGLPTWYTAQMTWNNDRLGFTGPLIATTGTGFASTWQPGNHNATVVGTATFTPTQSVLYRGTLSYTFDAPRLTVTKVIERLTLTAFQLEGEFAGAQRGDYYDCAQAASDQSYVDRFDLTVSRNAQDVLTLAFEYDSGISCTLTGVVEQHGALHRIPLSPGARYTCSDGLDTVASVYELKVTSLGIEGRIYAPTVASGCKEVARFSAVHLSGFAAE